MKKRCKVIGLAAFAAYVVFRLLVCVKYTILTGSMMPTIQIEESVYVLKPLYGWRLYCFWSKSPDSFHRIHGIRDIVPGDIIVFNLPYIVFPIRATQTKKSIRMHMTKSRIILEDLVCDIRK